MAIADQTSPLTRHSQPAAFDAVELGAFPSAVPAPPTWGAKLVARVHVGAVCKSCGRGLDPRFGCRRRTCPGYLPTWAGDLSASIRDNVLGLDGQGRCDMVTITAPGAGWLPWDRERCRALGKHRCSGKLGCVVQADALARWNVSFADRLSMLMNAAREDVRRQWNGPNVHVGDGERFRMPRYVLMVEPQARGALHCHVVFATSDRARSFLLFRAMRRRADRYGFGERVGWDPHRSNERGTYCWAYVSKLGRYLDKESRRGEGGHLLEVVRAMPGRRLCRASVTLTRETRATMRNYRLRRWAWRVLQLPGEARVTCEQAERLHLCHRLWWILKHRQAVALDPPDALPSPWWRTVDPGERAFLVALGGSFTYR